MTRFPDPIGARFGRLVVEAGAPWVGYRRRWLCRCDCGVALTVDAANVKAGYTQSCGCLKHERNVNQPYSRTHGMNKTPEHRAWSSMIQRCTNEKQDSFADYGGRGITVCERWLRSFEAFFINVGPRPSPAHTLDRKDTNGNYEPGNVRWATRAQQAQNRRSTVLNWDLVNEIRGRWEHGESSISISRRMGIRSARISAVLLNKVWAQ